jgi:DNA-binding transcriptional ArsR family regulator
MSAPEPLDDVLRAIAEPRRRAILQLVADEELAAGEIAARFEVTRPAISQHLTVLKDAGLLTERRDGTRRLYRARPEGLSQVEAFVAGMWGSALQRFKVLAEGEARPAEGAAGPADEGRDPPQASANRP